MAQELWAPIAGFPYEVSETGQVRNLRGRVKTPRQKRNGYFQVALYRDGRAHHIGVHRLVAEAFIPNPNGKSTVNHINGVKGDNRAVNLEWATPSENTNHGLRLGLLTSGEARYNAKLTAAQVRAIRSSTTPLRVDAEKYGVSISCIWNVRNRVSWRWSA